MARLCDLGIKESNCNFIYKTYYNLKASEIYYGQQYTLQKQGWKSGQVISKAEYIEYTGLDKPEIKINGIEYPNDVEYNDQFKISFLLSRESNSIPENVEITLSQNSFEKTWTLKELSDDRKFVINLLGKNLKKGLNEFNIIVKYEDGNGRPYETKETFVVELVNVTLIQNILLVLNQFVLFLNNLVS